MPLIRLGTEPRYAYTNDDRMVDSGLRRIPPESRITEFANEIT